MRNRELPFHLAPEILRPGLAIVWRHFIERTEGIKNPQPSTFVAEIVKLWGSSEFASQSCLQDPTLLTHLFSHPNFSRPRAPGDLAQELAKKLDKISDGTALAHVLRVVRREELVRIAWRDITGWATLNETLSDLSTLADCCLEQALFHLDAWQRESWGTPCNDLDETQSLCVLAMGKLGGEELNFSSDIDLIFIYGEEGETRGKRRCSNAEYFHRLGQRLIRILDENTVDGFVFRVDMRLRPNGESGPLVLPFDAFENYYALSGRDWERYAMIKARPVAGNLALGQRLLDTLRPFIYRRYLDFNAIDSLREMKHLITHQVQRQKAEENIKLGAGGIRDVEFIAQSLQLLWGGRYPELRTPSTQRALIELASLGFIPSEEAASLLNSYTFLRQLENRLQAIEDRQIQQLPEDTIKQARLAYAMGYESYPLLQAALHNKRQSIIQAFDTLLGAKLVSPTNGSAHTHALLWADELSETAAEAALSDAYITEPHTALDSLHQFRLCPAVRALSEGGRARLDRLMPLLLDEIGVTPEPALTFNRLLGFLESIVRRTTYIALLLEVPRARAELIRLLGASPWIAQRLRLQPSLLDELLHLETPHHRPSQETLEGELARRMQGVTPGDIEQEMEVLRQFKEAQMLHVAAAEVSGREPLIRVSDTLSNIAQTVLARTLILAWRDVQKRSARSEPSSNPSQSPPTFGIVGYGKLGGIELNYESDLDLIFLYADADERSSVDNKEGLDNQTIFTRLGQRIMHYLTTRTPAGIAYEIDMRLRPSGNSGLLVNTLDRFADYQQKHAWTWEHQALVRARFVAGDPEMKKGFDATRHRVLSQPRGIGELREDIVSMRERMRKTLAPPEGFDLKHSPGGMIDIEFIAQFGVLAWSAKVPTLTRWSDNIRLFESFAEARLMSVEDARALIEAYCALRNEHHRLLLLPNLGFLPGQPRCQPSPVGLIISVCLRVLLKLD